MHSRISNTDPDSPADDPDSEPGPAPGAEADDDGYRSL